MPTGIVRSVLVIEDQAIVASDLQRFLDGTGYHVVGPMCSPDEALDTIANCRLDGAVLDVKLLGGASPQVADALKAAKVPHIFVNGWADGEIPERCRGRLLNNPYDYRSLLDALNGVMAEKSGG
jgi:DNA-binding NarL/FixJ family response regulator